MVSPENTNWLYDYGFEDIPVLDANLPAPNSGFSWSVQALKGSSNFGVEIDGCSFEESGVQKETGSKKRSRTELCTPLSSKACREKQRRDRLNDKFLELGAVLEPGRPAKTDKAAILVDAVRMVNQLRGEAQKLKDSNTDLQEKIKELKVLKGVARTKPALGSRSFYLLLCGGQLSPGAMNFEQVMMPQQPRQLYCQRQGQSERTSYQQGQVQVLLKESGVEH